MQEPHYGVTLWCLRMKNQCINTLPGSLCSNVDEAQELMKRRLLSLQHEWFEMLSWQITIWPTFLLKKMEEKSSGKAAPFGLAGYSFFWAWKNCALCLCILWGFLVINLGTWNSPFKYMTSMNHEANNCIGFSLHFWTNKTNGFPILCLVRLTLLFGVTCNTTFIILDFFRYRVAK